jgi:putative oxidoreductase
MSQTGNPILRMYDGFVKAVSALQSPFLLLVRIYWGWQLSQNGWAKLHSLPKVTEFFSSL